MITANRLRAKRSTEEPAQVASVQPTIATVQELTKSYEARLSALRDENEILRKRVAELSSNQQNSNKRR